MLWYRDGFGMNGEKDCKRAGNFVPSGCSVANWGGSECVACLEMFEMHGREKVQQCLRDCRVEGRMWKKRKEILLVGKRNLIYGISPI